MRSSPSRVSCHQSYSSTRVMPSVREPRLQPQRHEEARAPLRHRGEARHGVRVEMVVVVVRDQHEIDLRQFGNVDRQRHDALRTRERAPARHARRRRDRTGCSCRRCARASSRARSTSPTGWCPGERSAAASVVIAGRFQPPGRWFRQSRRAGAPIATAQKLSLPGMRIVVVKAVGPLRGGLGSGEAGRGGEQPDVGEASLPPPMTVARQDLHPCATCRAQRPCRTSRPTRRRSRG